MNFVCFNEMGTFMNLKKQRKITSEKYLSVRFRYYQTKTVDSIISFRGLLFAKKTALIRKCQINS